MEEVPRLEAKADGRAEERIREAGRLVQRCIGEVSRRLVGQRPMIEGMLIGLLARGHILLEGVPGLAKTLAVKTLAEVLDVRFRRLQFTPDLLPADLIGTMVYHQHTGEFVPRKGPIFTNIILADEINRSPAKVQSALLEAMEERQVTLGGETYPLEQPFLVLATQNPIEHEGTYALPEAQLDRFLLKLTVSYPAFREEVEILRRMGGEEPIRVEKALGPRELLRLQEAARSVRVDSRIEEYIVTLVGATRGGWRRDGEGAAGGPGAGGGLLPGEEARSVSGRPSPARSPVGERVARFVEVGASPRASLYLYRCARARALLEGRSFVIPEDVKAVAPAVLRHRIILTYEAESESLSADTLIGEILRSVPVP